MAGVYKHDPVREVQAPDSNSDRIGEAPNLPPMSQEAHEILKPDVQFCELDGHSAVFGRKSKLRVQQIRTIIELYKTTKLTGRVVALQVGCTLTQVYDTWQQFRNGVFNEFTE